MTIQDSLQRVLADRDGVSALFYEVFFERHPEAKPLFDGVNLKHQVVLLTMALMVIERQYGHGYLATELYLKHLGHKHHVRNVPPELYPKWIDCLLTALERFHGSEWDDEAAMQWRAALDSATTLMLLGYEAPVPV